MQYQIAPGDTLTALARRFGTTPQALAQANGITNPDRIRAGQAIEVPTAPLEGSEPGPARPQAGPTYTVRAGDNLSTIAQRLGTTVQALAQINGISDPNRIRAGQVLNTAASAPQPAAGMPLPRARPEPQIPGTTFAGAGPGTQQPQLAGRRDAPPPGGGQPMFATQPLPQFPADLSTVPMNQLSSLFGLAQNEQQRAALYAEVDRRRQMAEVGYQQAGGANSRFPPEIQATNRRIGTDMRIAPPAPPVNRSVLGEGEYLPDEQRLLMQLRGNMNNAPKANTMSPQLGFLGGFTRGQRLGNLTGPGV